MNYWNSMNNCSYQIDKAEIYKRFRYISANTILFDYHIILVKNSKLKIGNAYIKIGSWFTDSSPRPVKLLDVWDNDCISYLKIQDLQTGKTEILSHNLHYIGEVWIWSLASLDYLCRLTENGSTNIEV
jgi:hypothetical protein